MTGTARARAGADHGTTAGPGDEELGDDRHG